MPILLLILEKEPGAAGIDRMTLASAGRLVIIVLWLLMLSRFDIL